jgi:hypothetical protein
VIAPLRLDVGRHLGAHRDVEVGAAQAQAALGGLDEQVGEHRERGLPGTLAATAPSPSWSFSREMVKRMPEPGDARLHISALCCCCSSLRHQRQ